MGAQVMCFSLGLFLLMRLQEDLGNFLERGWGRRHEGVLKERLGMERGKIYIVKPGHQ